MNDAIRKAIEALEELITLKDWKDANATPPPEYYVRKPKAWADAREALSALQDAQTPTISSNPLPVWGRTGESIKRGLEEARAWAEGEDVPVRVTTHPSDDLATVALAFAKEVLGWEDAAIHREYPSIIATENSFPFADLNAVMGTVRGWCDRNGNALLQIVYLNEGNGESFAVDIHGEGMEILADVGNDNLCHALLSACVEANRRMKEVANG